MTTEQEMIARHIAVLKSMKDRTPVYMGDAPKAQRYQECHAAFDAAIAILTTLASRTPEGMVMVPREPTEAMLKAGWQQWEGGTADECSAIYRAMLSASPTPSGAE